MIRTIISILLVVTFLSPLHAQTEDRDKLEKSIDKALQFLQKNQDSSGAWKLYLDQSTASTSLAVMAFLSAGHVPGEGPYGETVEKGIEWVLQKQRPDGLLGSFSYQMYEHGISTLMLAEVSGMTNKDLSPKVKTALEKAIKVILQAQRTSGTHKGGWRYNVNSPDADLSVTGWQLMALRAAKNVGCDIPAERMEMAVDYVRRSFVNLNQAGAFRYTIGGGETVPCTGTGILCLELCDKHHTLEAIKSGAYLIKAHNLPQTNGTHFFYNVYYGSQATFQLGGNYWNLYRPHLHKILLGHQAANGSWGGNQQNAYSSYGPVYGTSMCVLALTVEFRYLPIYQRDQDAKEEKE